MMSRTSRKPLKDPFKVEDGGIAAGSLARLDAGLTAAAAAASRPVRLTKATMVSVDTSELPDALASTNTAGV